MDLRESIQKGWAHLDAIHTVIHPSERDTYAGVLRTCESSLFDGVEEGVEARLVQLRDWLTVWLLPRLRGESPPACDPFGVGLPCRWEGPEYVPARHQITVPA